MPVAQEGPMFCVWEAKEWISEADFQDFIDGPMGPNWGMSVLNNNISKINLELTGGQALYERKLWYFYWIVKSTCCTTIFCIANSLINSALWIRTETLVSVRIQCLSRSPLSNTQLDRRKLNLELCDMLIQSRRRASMWEEFFWGRMTGLVLDSFSGSRCDSEFPDSESSWGSYFYILVSVNPTDVVQ